MVSQWKKLHTGDQVRLYNTDHVGEVVGVRMARDLLLCMNEIEAMRFGLYCRSLYGVNWMQIYYEADVVLNKKLVVVKPTEVKEVIKS